MAKVAFWPTVSDNIKKIGLSEMVEGLTVDWLSSDLSNYELARQLSGIEYFLCFVRKWPSEVYAALDGVRLVQMMDAGYDLLNIELCRRYRILVCGNGGANAVAVAEHTILLMLAVLRSLTAFDRELRTGTYVASPSFVVVDRQLFEMEGRTVGLVGLGAIGREVARRLHPFGARLLYYDPVRASADVENSLTIAFRDYPKLLAESDIISFHAQLTDTTRRMFDARAVAETKPGAVVINTSRGEIIDEAALTYGLKSGHLGGAGLDVFVNEPPSPDHPLLMLGERVVATPHIAGPTWESWRKRFRNGFANIGRIERGESPKWIVPELRSLFS